MANVSFKAYYFIPLPELIPKISISLIRDKLKESGGIRLYRNGFRVRPYGEPYDDWLGLDKSSRTREILPPHSNLNFIGFAEVTDSHGTRFEETSSREGLLENTAFMELQDYLFRTLKAAVLPIAEARGRKKTAGQKNFVSQRKNTPKEQAQSIIEKLTERTKQYSDRDEQSRDEGESFFDQDIKEEIKALGEEGESLLEEIEMLRVLASLGLTIGEFTHEIKHSLGALVANFKLLRANSADSAAATHLQEGIDVNLESLQSYAQYFDRAIQDNVHRKRQALELRDVINTFEKIAKPLLLRESVVLEKDIQGYDLFAKPMHNSEWASVLLNLLTNAVKAIKRAKSEGKVLIRAGEGDGGLFLEFADNGIGIPPENEERIFNAFFTTSSPADFWATESEQLVGTGLGLKIVKDIIEAAEGEIYLVPPPQGYKTCFRIDIPKASEKEIPADAY